MSKTPSSSGKGSGRRKEDTAKVRARWDEIDWSKRPVKDIVFNGADLLASAEQAANHTKRINLSISDLDKMREV